MYAKELEPNMQKAYKLASENACKSATKGKRLYDRKVRSSCLQEGDRVLVKNLLERGGPGKLRSYWEENIYVVLRRLNDESPVYEVKKDNGTGRNRVLHRNLLMQCDSLPLESTTSANGSDNKKTDYRKTQKSKFTHNDVVKKDRDNSNGLTYNVRSTDRYSKLPTDGIHVDNEADNFPNVVSDDESEINIPNNIENVTSKDKPARLRHPAAKFTYDTLGKPSIQTLNVNSNHVRQYPTTFTTFQLESNLNLNSVTWFPEHQQP